MTKYAHPEVEVLEDRAVPACMAAPLSLGASLAALENALAAQVQVLAAAPVAGASLHAMEHTTTTLASGAFQVVSVETWSTLATSAGSGLSTLHADVVDALAQHLSLTQDVQASAATAPAATASPGLVAATNHTLETTVTVTPQSVTTTSLETWSSVVAQGNLDGLSLGVTDALAQHLSLTETAPTVTPVVGH